MTARRIRTASGRPHRSRAARCASPSTGSRFRDLRAIRWRRRCWPTACIWSGARSSITGRAASVACGSEEPNALVDGDARRRARDAEPAGDAGRALRRARGRQPEPLAVARRATCGAINDRLSPIFAGRILLQDLHVAAFLPDNWAWTRCYEPAIRRAAGLGTGADARRSGSLRAAAIAHCDVLVVGAGPAGLAAATAPRPARARVSSSRTSRPSWAARC